MKKLLEGSISNRIQLMFPLSITEPGGQRWVNRAIWNKQGLPERGEQFLSAMVTDDSSPWSRLKRVDGEEEEKQTHLLRLHT